MTQPWLRLYREERGSFAQLPLTARSLFSQLLKASDDNGRIDLGPKGPVDAIAWKMGADRGDRRFLKKNLELLFQEGSIVHDTESRALRFPNWRRWQPDSAATAPRSDHDRTTKRPRSRHEPTTTMPRTDHDGATTEPRSDHDRATTEQRPDHEATTTAPRSDHDGATIVPRPDHDRATKPDLSTRNHTRARKRREEEIRREKIKLASLAESALVRDVAYRDFQDVVRSLGDDVFAGDITPRIHEELKRFAERFPELTWDDEVAAWRETLAPGFQLEFPWAHFRKHFGRWRAIAEGRRSKPQRPGPAEPAPASAFEGDTFESIDAKFDRFEARFAEPSNAGTLFEESA